MCLYEGEQFTQLELLEDEEKRAIEDAEVAYDLHNMSEQEEILQITMREIAQQDLKRESEHRHFGSAIIMKEYATGTFPSLVDVTKENRVSSYTPAYNSGYGGTRYGVWDKDGRWNKDGVRPVDDEDRRPWANRFDDDDGVCRDPYAYYSGDWY